MVRRRFKTGGRREESGGRTRNSRGGRHVRNGCSRKPPPLTYRRPRHRPPLAADVRKGPRQLRGDPSKPAGLAVLSCHAAVSPQPHRQADRRKRPLLVVQRIETIVADHEPDVASYAAAARIGNVPHDRVGQVDDAMAGIERTDAEVLLLAVEDEALAIS